MVSQVFTETACFSRWLRRLSVASREFQGLWENIHGWLMVEPCVPDISLANVWEKQAVGVRPLRSEPTADQGQFVLRVRSSRGCTYVRPCLDFPDTLQLKATYCNLKTFREQNESNLIP